MSNSQSSFNPNVIPDVSQERTIWIPSLEACQQFGIERIGAKKLSEQTKYSFLNGPQFKNFLKPEEKDAPNCMDEVVIDFIGNTPTALKPRKDASGIVRMEYDLSTKVRLSNPLFRFRIIPKQQDWLEFALDHNWDEKDGIVSQALDALANVVDSLSGILNTAKNVTNLDNPEALKSVTLDKQDAYKGTAKISFNIPFVLFTMGKPLHQKDNFIKRWVLDIYKPLVFLTTWTHPKRDVGILKTKEGKEIDTSQANSASQLAQSNPKTDSGDIQEDILKLLSSYPGVRVAISEPPSYVRIFHTSGFFRFDICAITKLNYKFVGPWVKASAFTKDGDNYSEIDRYLLDVSLPLVVDGSITVKVIEKLYADDWLNMFEHSPLLKAAGEVGEGIIKVNSNRTNYENAMRNVTNQILQNQR